LVAGDSATWIKTLSDYPASDGWALSYVLKLTEEEEATATVSADGAEYTVTIPASETEGITESQSARLVGRLTGSGATAGQRITIYDGRVEISPDPEESSLEDSQSAAEKELAAITAAILALTTTGIQAYSIGSRSVTKADLKTLYQRQAVLESRVRSEQGRKPPRHLVAFSGI
jgi:hypothetical protein